MTHTSTEQAEALALQLAQFFKSMKKSSHRWWCGTPVHIKAAEEFERLQASLTSALEDIASGEITRSHCVGHHCTEETGVAIADEMASRAAGALDWLAITQEKQG